MEHLSICYVSAVVARAGAKFTPEPQPEYGIDGRVQYVKEMPNGQFQDTGFAYFVQIKSSTRCREDGSFVVYEMDVEAYNKLANYEGLSPAYLILYQMPSTIDDFVRWSDSELMLRSCSYYYEIPPVVSLNKRSVTIRIPKEQAFTPYTVSRLLNELRVRGLGNG